MTPDELLEAAARADEHSPEQVLLVTAAVESILGSTSVLVGGAAVNTYTGEYRPTDVDIVAPVGKRERGLLAEHGFEDPGFGHRHLRLHLGGQAPVLVEFPGGALAGEEVEEVEVAPGVIARVISLTDLVADRLRQATDGSAVTYEEALALVTATFDTIDWLAVQSRTERDPLHQQMAELLGRVKREAEKARRNI